MILLVNIAHNFAIKDIFSHFHITTFHTIFHHTFLTIISIFARCYLLCSHLEPIFRFQLFAHLFAIYSSTLFLDIRCHTETIDTVSHPPFFFSLIRTQIVWAVNNFIDLLPVLYTICVLIRETNPVLNMQKIL